MKIVEHNGVQLVFNPENHSYTDSEGRNYTSVTSLIEKAFPIFDSEAAAKRKSVETGIPYQKYLEEWKRIGETAAQTGKRMHEIAENVILKRENLIFATREEKFMLQEIKNTVSSLEKRWILEPEKIIFSRKHRIAGTIDILGGREKDFAIFDWKRIKKLERNSRNHGTIPPTSHLDDCNYVHYSLQTALYEQILREEHYIPQNAIVKRFLLVRNAYSGAFNPVCCGDFITEAMKLLEWNQRNFW